jgi:sugar-specific transcriptional regulator TrmB
MGTESLVEQMTSLGLTTSEAKAYVSVVRLGRSAARAIHEDSGIPRSKVYEVLTDLEEKGYVRTVIGTKPTLFEPTPVDAVMGDLEERAHASVEASKRLLKSLEAARVEEMDEFAWATQGRDQVIMDLRGAIERAKEFIFAATAAPDLLGPVRVPLGAAKKRGLKVELHTTSFGLGNVSELEHYIDAKLVAPSSEVLVRSMAEVLDAPSVAQGEFRPDQLLIMVIDGKESIAVFRPSIASQAPWSLHIRSPLVVMFQWQVVKTILASVERMVQELKS